MSDFDLAPRAGDLEQVVGTDGVLRYERVLVGDGIGFRQPDPPGGPWRIGIVRYLDAAGRLEPRW